MCLNGKLKARDKCASLAFKKKKKSPSARVIGTGIGKNIGTFLIMRTEEAFLGVRGGLSLGNHKQLSYSNPEVATNLIV